MLKWRPGEPHGSPRRFKGFQKEGPKVSKEGKMSSKDIQKDAPDPGTNEVGLGGAALAALCAHKAKPRLTALSSASSLFVRRRAT